MKVKIIPIELVLYQQVDSLQNTNNYILNSILYFLIPDYCNFNRFEINQGIDILLAAVIAEV